MKLGYRYEDRRGKKGPGRRQRKCTGPEAGIAMGSVCVCVGGSQSWAAGGLWANGKTFGFGSENS